MQRPSIKLWFLQHMQCPSIKLWFLQHMQCPSIKLWLLHSLQRTCVFMRRMQLMRQHDQQ